MYEEITFKNKYYSSIKDYFDNNALLISNNNNGPAVYVNGDENFHGVILYKKGDINDPLISVKITKDNPLKEKIKKDLAELTKEN